MSRFPLSVFRRIERYAMQLHFLPLCKELKIYSKISREFKTKCSSVHSALDALLFIFEVIGENMEMWETEDCHYLLPQSEFRSMMVSQIIKKLAANIED